MKYLLIIIALSPSYSFGQFENNILDTLKYELVETQKEIKLLKSSVQSNDVNLKKVESDLATQSNTLKALVNQKDKALRSQVTAIYDSLGTNTARVTANDTKFKTEQTKSEKNFLYSVIGILSLLLLLVVIYFLIQKRAKSIEQKAVDLDTITQQLKKQLSELSATTSEEFASTLEKFASISNGLPTTSADPDHSMVMEFAKQIVTMENNMSRMNLEDKGLKRIKKSIDKTKK
jgi:ATP-dependent Zn protease